MLSATRRSRAGTSPCPSPLGFAWEKCRAVQLCRLSSLMGPACLARLYSRRIFGLARASLQSGRGPKAPDSAIGAPPPARSRGTSTTRFIRYSGQMERSDGESWCVDETTVVGENLGSKVVGQSDVYGSAKVKLNLTRQASSKSPRTWAIRNGQAFSSTTALAIRSGGSTPFRSQRRRTAPHSTKKWSGTQGTLLAGSRPRRARPRIVSAASSTPAEASMTTGVTPRQGRAPLPECPPLGLETQEVHPLVGDPTRLETPRRLPRHRDW
jgi:hypothetical protein